MTTMDQSLADPVADDLVSAERANEQANDPAELRQLVSGETR